MKTYTIAGVKTKPYSALLTCLVLLFTLSPIFREIGELGFFTAILIGFTHVISLIAIYEQSPRFKVTCGLGILSLLSLSLVSLWPTPPLMLFEYAVRVPTFILITYILFIRLLTASEVTTDIVLGAISVYFLLGLTGGFLYEGIELLFPGAFSLNSAHFTALQVDEIESRLIYYSFMTITTIGYGDIVPIHPVARSFAMLEGIMGQMYIAIIVARLVALQTSTNSNQEVQ